MASMSGDGTLAPVSTGETQEQEFPPRLHRSLLAVIVAYFAARLVYYAFSISPAIPPDEVTHFGISEIFSRTALLPANTPDSFEFGLVTNIPWLYYWIMGKLLPLNLFGMDSLVYLRLWNIPLALAHLWYVSRMLRLLTGDRLAQILVLVMLTNTMMLTFLSASVSYDNLANLLAAMSMYHLLVFFRERSGRDLAISLLCQFAGCLTKITFLPLALALNLLLLLREARNLPALPAGLASFYRTSRKSAAPLTAALLLGLALNAQLYGGNYLRHGKLVLDTTDVLPLEDALQYRLAARGYVFGLFRDGKVGKEEALAMTSRIRHPGDRADAAFMIENYDRFSKGEIPRLSLPQYVPLWFSRMAAGIFGVFGHLQIVNGWPTIAPVWGVAAAALAAFLLRWRPRGEHLPAACMAAVAGFYTLFLLYRFNYQNYLDNGAPFIALQGRYLFPVIGMIYVVAAQYLIKLTSARRGRIGICAGVSAVFLLSDFPLFLSRATPQWFF